MSTRSTGLVPESASPSLPRSLPTIQALRALAAALVVFHHFARLYRTPHLSFISDSGLGQLCICGVDIFFVISGVIMTYSTRRLIGVDDAVTFIRKRAERIFPLYWLWSFVLLALWLSHAIRLGHYTSKFLFYSFLLVPTSNGQSYYPLVMQGWTLSFEMLFYLAFSVCLACGFRQYKLLALGAIFATLSLCAQFLPESGVRWLLTNTLVIEFLYGVLIGEVLLRMKTRVATWVPYSLMGAGFIGFLNTLRIADSGNLRFLVFGVPAALVVLGATLRGDKPVPDLLKFLGDASYSIYLVHSFFTLAFASALKNHHAVANLPPDAVILVLGCVTIALSSLTYIWVEKPITDLLKRRPWLTPRSIPEPQRI